MCWLGLPSIKWNKWLPREELIERGFLKVRCGRPGGALVLQADRACCVWRGWGKGGGLRKG